MKEAKELWNLRQDVMKFEDEQESIRQEIDQYKNYALGNDELIGELIQEHNELAASFEKEVELATEHLQSKLEEIKNRKIEIHTYQRYILLNDELLKDLTLDYTQTKDKWKSAITSYTIGLDSFVDSGEEKDV